jgi:hypothetical protein
VVTQYDDVALYPPAYFHPTVGESKSNPDAKGFLLGAHLFAGTWVEANRKQHRRLWIANAKPITDEGTGTERHCPEESPGNMVNSAKSTGYSRR